MRSSDFLKVVVAVVLLGSGVNCYAYSAGEVEELCKKPKIHDFSLPVYQEPEKIEVAPESDLSFSLSVWTNPDTIKLTIKDEPLEFTRESNTSIHKIRAKIPAKFTGQFARINITATAVLGCYTKEGFLIKVANSEKN
ncbi:MAG: hypothetical protein PHC99_10970 [Methylococcales bacterium]|nr:hypothetical protein [Methylococcales bacterium]